MDITMVVRKQDVSGRTLYLTGEMAFSLDKREAWQYLSHIAFTDAELTDSEVYLRFADGNEMLVSQHQVFHPTHDTVQ